MSGNGILDDKRNVEDLRRYQAEYYDAKHASDISSLRSAIEYFKGERRPPSPMFYQAQELIQDLKDYKGMTLSELTVICGLSTSVIKRLSSGDFRSIAYLHTARVIRRLEPLSQDDFEDEEPFYSFVDPTSRRERRRKRKLRKSQERSGKNS